MITKFTRHVKKIFAGKLLPTDKEIFEFTYKKYYDEFIDFKKGEKNNRQTKNFIPINTEEIADHFGVDKDIIFSRFYHYYKDKYDYKKENGTNVSFFLNKLEKEKHVVHFPYLTSILAKLRYEDEKFNISILISIFAVIIAFLSFYFK